MDTEDSILHPETPMMMMMRCGPQLTHTTYTNTMPRLHINLTQKVSLMVISVLFITVVCGVFCALSHSDFLQTFDFTSSNLLVARSTVI